MAVTFTTLTLLTKTELENIGGVRREEFVMQDVQQISTWNEKSLFIEPDRHEHEADRSEVAVRKIVTGIKRKAEQHPNERPSVIWRDEVADVSDEEILMNLPERNTILCDINRRQNRGRPAVPMRLRDIVIRNPYDITFRRQRFLQYDNGLHNRNRILIFFAPKALQLLVNSATLFADGTFKKVPKSFYQLYTIHGLFRGHVFPFIYALTPRKTQETYAEIWNYLKTRCNAANRVLNPLTIVTDFELAALNAEKEVFPNANIRACLFHFTQAIWSYAVTQLRLKNLYINDNDVRIAVRKLPALPFIPLLDLRQVFRGALRDLPDTVRSLGQYIAETYVIGRPGRGRRRALPPRFEPEIWNVFELVQNRIQRTNNYAEVWHSRFQRSLQTHHGRIWKFLEFIKKDQRENEVVTTQLAGGHTRVRYPISHRYFINQMQVEAIVNNYEEYKAEDNVDQYLRAISYKLKLYNPPEAEDDDDEDEEEEDEH